METHAGSDDVFADARCMMPTSFIVPADHLWQHLFALTAILNTCIWSLCGHRSDEKHGVQGTRCHCGCVVYPYAPQMGTPQASTCGGSRPFVDGTNFADATWGGRGPLAGADAADAMQRRNQTVQPAPGGGRDSVAEAAPDAEEEATSDGNQWRQWKRCFKPRPSSAPPRLMGQNRFSLIDATDGTESDSGGSDNDEHEDESCDARAQEESDAEGDTDEDWLEDQGPERLDTALRLAAEEAARGLAAATASSGTKGNNDVEPLFPQMIAGKKSAALEAATASSGPAALEAATALSGTKGNNDVEPLSLQRIAKKKSAAMEAATASSGPAALEAATALSGTKGNNDVEPLSLQMIAKKKSAALEAATASSGPAALEAATALSGTKGNNDVEPLSLQMIAKKKSAAMEAATASSGTAALEAATALSGKKGNNDVEPLSLQMIAKKKSAALEAATASSGPAALEAATVGNKDVEPSIPLMMAATDKSAAPEADQAETDHMVPEANLQDKFEADDKAKIETAVQETPVPAPEADRRKRAVAKKSAKESALTAEDRALDCYARDIRAIELLQAGWSSQHPRVAALIDRSLLHSD